MSRRQWSDRVALVTGASSGIGEAIAYTLSEMGMKVALIARRADRLATIAETISHRGGEVVALTANVREDREILAAFDSVRAKWGGVDVLVNSAGLGRVAPLSSGPTEAWREMLEVNVLALAVCTREALSDIRRRGDEGHIIHISSMSGHRVPTGTGGMYSATKHAVKAMTEALRRELYANGSATRVTALSPGFVETEFAEVMLGDEVAAQSMYDRYPCLKPADIAETVKHVLEQPAHVHIHDILLRPLRQES
jgi:17beta-estradiol 17-dehydrogenase / 3beta-hydroxysteroid 3-dehydrogenase